MNKILSKLVKLGQLIRAFFPSALPIGVTEGNAWLDSIVNLYNLPDNDSTRFALSSMIGHMNPTAAFKSKFYFALLAWKSMANQIAYAKMHELKEKQQALVAKEKAEAEAQLAKKLEATQLKVVSNEPVQN